MNILQDIFNTIEKILNYLFIYLIRDLTLTPTKKKSYIQNLYVLLSLSTISEHVVKQLLFKHAKMLNKINVNNVDNI